MNEAQGGGDRSNYSPRFESHANAREEKFFPNHGRLIHPTEGAADENLERLSQAWLAHEPDCCASTR